MEVRAKLTLRNEAVLKAREARGWSQEALAAASGASIHDVQRIEYLDFSSRRTEDVAAKLAAALGLTFDEVCPEDAIGEKVPSTFVATKRVDLQDVLRFKESTTRRLVMPSPDEAREDADKRNMAAASMALEMLPPRLRQIIELRYGLGENSEAMTLNAVAEKLHRSNTRIRQQEGKALRLLQHPIRSVAIEAALEG